MMAPADIWETTSTGSSPNPAIATLNDWRIEFMRNMALQVLLLSMFVVLQAGWAGAQSNLAAPTSTSAASGSDEQAERQQMREELKALREEVERLRAEVELRKGAAPANFEATPAAAKPPSAPPPAAETNVGKVPAVAAPAQPAVAVATAAASSESAPAKKAKIDPFSDWDWTWLNGNPRTKEPAFDSKFFTPEIRADTTYTYDFNKPRDNTISGSSEIFRSNEIQLEQLGLGGDFHYDNVRARFMTQFGMYSATTPRNDASPAKGQWDLDTAYRYLAEAYGGYHFNALNGINVDAGIFLSYIGLFSYYNFDNWAYQPSYVSSNTPWFFNGLRVQIFPNPHLKIEPWLING